MTINPNSIKYIGEKNIPSEDIELENIGLTKEQLLLKNINCLAQEYIELERIKTEFSKIILQNIAKMDFSDFINYPKFHIKEGIIKKSVASSDIGGLKIVSIDGSSVVKKFMNVDFSFLKAMAVKYSFQKNHKAKIEYYPDLSGFNNYLIQGNYNKDENAVDAKISIDMTFMEINLLNKLIEKSDDIDVIIIDGSIVIMPINLIFSNDYEISKNYDLLLREYQRLYRNCKERGIILIGSIKDTRTSSLCHLLRDSVQFLKPSYSNLEDLIKYNYRDSFSNFIDIDLYNRLLEKSERSCIFHCKREIDKIRDIGIKKEISYYFPLTFYAFYLKTAKYDTPLRIEFFMDEKHDLEKASEKADLISSLILPISSLNEYYGLPIPQIEAHRRAVFKPPEIELLFNNLSRTLITNGINLVEKRRNRRPF